MFICDSCKLDDARMIFGQTGQSIRTLPHGVKDISGPQSLA
jgi:hypothetical protein